MIDLSRNNIDEDDSNNKDDEHVVNDVKFIKQR